MLYLLGIGVAVYLGESIDRSLFAVGLLWAVFLQLSTHYLNEYYNYSEDNANPNTTPFSGGSGALGAENLQPRTALIAGLSCLAVVASLSVVLFSQFEPNLTTVFIMGLAFLGSFFYSVPPIRLERSGYGELTTSVLVAFLLPSFSYALQFGEIHVFVAMSAIPLTMIHLAMMLVFELPDYAVDMKFGKQTLMVRLGWKNGITLHHIVLLCGYLLLIAELFLGLPLVIVLHAFISLPFAAFQVWQIYRISRGAAPDWAALTLNALATFGAMVYFMTFAYWTGVLSNGIY